MIPFKSTKQLFEEHAWMMEALEKDTEKLKALKEHEKNLKSHEKKGIQKGDYIDCK